MKKGGKGGANTKTGLKFEEDTDMKSLLQDVTGYKIEGDVVYFNNKKIAEFFSKHDLYSRLLSKYEINWRERASSRLVPDEAILILKTNTLFIVEKKIQNGSGSVDEKLQTCDFKKKKYLKLLSGTGIKIEFVYVLSDWFNQERLRDSFNYIESVGCHYFFNVLPLKFINLPEPK